MVEIIEQIQSSLSLLTAGHRLALLRASLLGVLINLLDFLGAALFVYMINFFSSSQNVTNTWLGAHLRSFSKDVLTDHQFITCLALGILFLFAFKGILSVRLTNRLEIRLGRAAAEVSESILENLLKRDLPIIQSRSTQEVAWLLDSGVTRFVCDISVSLNSVLIDLALISMFLIILCITNFWLTFFLFTYIALSLYVVSRFTFLKSRRAGAAVKEASVTTTSILQDCIFSFREILISNQISFPVEKLGRSQRNASTAKAQVNLYQNFPKKFIEFLVISSSALIAAILYVEGTTSAKIFSTLALLGIISTRLSPAVMRLQGNLLFIKSQGRIRSDFDSFILDSGLKLPGVTTEFVQESNPGAFIPSVQLIDVSYKYPSSSDLVVANLNLKLAPYETIGIVGPSGAGKSTIVDLILGVIRPEEGKVLVSEVSPRNSFAIWPGKTAYVPQTSGVLNVSLCENIAIGVPKSEISEERIRRVLDIVNLTDVFDGHPEGIWMNVGERGVKLSGGQRQRVGLARALYSNPELIILDEATSSLDSTNEKFVMDAILKIRGNCTLIVVAHRLSTVQNLDRLVYVEAGRIQKIGTFTDLISSIPNFAQQASLSGLSDG